MTRPGIVMTVIEGVLCHAWDEDEDTVVRRLEDDLRTGLPPGLIDWRRLRRLHAPGVSAVSRMSRAVSPCDTRSA